MKKIDLQHSVSLLANLGVVIGLILLIVELDQNSDLMTAQIQQSRSDAYVAVMEARSDSDNLVLAIDKVRAAGGWRNPSALDGLSDEERARIRWYLAGRRGDYENLYYQYINGYLDEEYYVCCIQGGIRTFAPWWERLGQMSNMRPSFAVEIERIMAAD